MRGKSGVPGAPQTQVGYSIGRKFGGSPTAGKVRHGHTKKAHRSSLRP